MDFLYRLPLVQFDPNSEDKILENWHWIQKAIQLSSDSFYHAIKGKLYLELDSKQQLKIYKFLLRGRYRATPFGLWAGVGLGKWDDETSAIIDCNSEAIDRQWKWESESEKDLYNGEECYQINPNICQKHIYIRYFSFDPKSGKWIEKMIANNTIITKVIEYLSTNFTIDYLVFSNFFELKDNLHINRIWHSILNSGILQPKFNINKYHISNYELEKEKTDLKIIGNPKVSRAVQYSLETIRNELGNLFIPSESEELNSFKHWFEEVFDDRLVLLQDIITQPGFNWDELQPQQVDSWGNNYKSEVSFSLPTFGQAKSIDLSQYFHSKPMVTDIHLDVLFRIGQDNSILVDNMVINRPFVYSGRFSRDHDIEKYLREEYKNYSLEGDDYLYAELLISESQKANHISSTKSICSKQLCLFSKTEDPKILNSDDIWIRFYKGKFELFDKEFNKRIIPVIQHPLNPNYISHPLSRLVWEIANQERFKFIGYQHPVFLDSNYCPQLTWKGLVLQSRQWNLKKENFDSVGTLLNFLNVNKIPYPILAGNHDQELLLHWNQTKDLSLFWEELQRQHSLTIREAPWYGSSYFQNKYGLTLYPQFVKSWQASRKENISFSKLNPRMEKLKDWVYIKVPINPSQLNIFLKSDLSSILLEIPENLLPICWYYVVYGRPELHLRLRFQIKSGQNKAFRNWILPRLMELCSEKGITQSEYFPEFEKYSRNWLYHSHAIFQLESELIIGKFDTTTSSILKETEIIRISLFADLWENVCIQLEHPDVFLKSLKETIDLIPLEIANMIKTNQEAKLRPYITEQFKLDYCNHFNQHGMFRDSSKSNEFLRNHLHMMVNRACPIHSYDYELQLIYWLYKRLKKQCILRGLIAGIQPRRGRTTKESILT